MRKTINEILNSVLDSLNTKSTGYSARKLTALATMIMVWIVHIKWLKSERWEYLGEILLMDLTFILALLGLTTWQKVNEKNNSGDYRPDGTAK
jgi:hypothetical protein